MSRKAVYNSDRTARVISLHSNKGFVVQRLTGGQGTKTFDPWVDDSRPMSHAKAHARLSSIEVKKAES